MTALLAGYALTGTIIWIGVISEILSNGHTWQRSDSYGLPLTFICLALLWPFAIAHWQKKEWEDKKNGRSRSY